MKYTKKARALSNCKNIETNNLKLQLDGKENLYYIHYSPKRMLYTRLIRVAKVLRTGEVPKETRGGDQTSHKLNNSKHEVREFLKNLRGQESHYGRNKSKRIYLNSNLSVSKLYKQYLATQNEEIPKVSFSTFNRIFYNEFDIGFKSPASDICSMCQRLKHSILREKDPIKKQEFITERRVHRLKADAFYSLMRETPPNTKIFCFDLQQVQPLPKTPVSDAFYLRQISYYTLCLAENNTSNPKLFTWTEDEAGRGATEIASAIYGFLNDTFETFVDKENTVMHLRFFCDGCGGQNKNSHIIHALMYWLQSTKSQIQSITIIFPVRGHSFLPADRIFGRVERILKKEAFIKKEETYHELYKQVGEVKVLGQHWKLFNIKGLETLYKKLNGISSMKKIVLKKQMQKGNSVVLCRGLCNYRFEAETEKYENLAKRGRSFTNFSLEEISLGRILPPKKIQNLQLLLKADFNDDWEADPELAWFKQLVEKHCVGESTDHRLLHQDDGEDYVCDCLIEETPAVHI
nr:unnamed protein product [Callosobruchus analis]